MGQVECLFLRDCLKSKIKRIIDNKDFSINFIEKEKWRKIIMN